MNLVWQKRGGCGVSEYDDISPTLQSEGGSHQGGPERIPIVFEPRYARNGRGAPDEIVPPLKAQSGRTGKGDSAPVVAYGFSQESDGSTVRNASDLARPVTGRHGDPGVVAFDWQAGGSGNDTSFRGKSRAYITRKGDYAQIRKNAHDAVAGNFGVRRLMPIECERLQAFQDKWTDVDGMSDSARYRMLGNAVCVNVAEWIGKRIVEVID